MEKKNNSGAERLRVCSFRPIADFISRMGPKQANCVLRRDERDDVCHDGTSEKLHYPLLTPVLDGTTWHSVVTFRPGTLYPLVRQIRVFGFRRWSGQNNPHWIEQRVLGHPPCSSATVVSYLVCFT